MGPQGLCKVKVDHVEVPQHISRVGNPTMAIENPLESTDKSIAYSGHLFLMSLSQYPVDSSMCYMYCTILIL